MRAIGHKNHDILSSRRMCTKIVKNTMSKCFKYYETLSYILSKQKQILFNLATEREAAKDLKLNIYHATFYFMQENQISPYKFCYKNCINLKYILIFLNRCFKLMLERYWYIFNSKSGAPSLKMQKFSARRIFWNHPYKYGLI